MVVRAFASLCAPPLLLLPVALVLGATTHL
jgi:hypothetical protein